ncbi:MAG: hypothetical protein PHC68_00625 [Syntrophorhabdaceae bacterium]|nr:hypothetical protein [Syntrophorhabdaceae bacterium]
MGREIVKKVERSVFDIHQLKIARATLKMSDLGVRLMGGMTKGEAREIVNKFGKSGDQEESS